MSARTARAGALLAAVSVGALVAVQARFNGDLAVRMGGGMTGGVQAAFISFLVGLMAISLLVAVVPKLRRGVAAIPRSVATHRLAWWQLLGGLGGAFLILTQAASVPVLGVAVFTVAVVAGQTGAGLVVDGVGLGPGGRQAVTVRRVAAAVATVGAVLLAVSGRLGVAGFSLPLALMCVGGGAAVSLQSALNGQVGRAAGTPLAAAWLNFALGTAALGIGVALAAVGGHAFGALPHTWWLYTGGLMGLAFVAVVTAVVGAIGVLLVTLATVAGQLIGAVLLDAVFPVAGQQLTAVTVVGTLLTLAAVAVGSAARTARP